MNLKNNYLLNNCWSGPIKNVRFLILEMQFFKNIKKHLKISLFYTCVPKILIWCTVLKILSNTDGSCLSFYTLLKTKKINILKKWKKHLKMSTLYTCIPKIRIIWCILPEIWSMTEFFCHFAPSFALLLHYWPGNLKFGEKN